MEPILNKLSEKRNFKVSNVSEKFVFTESGIATEDEIKQIQSDYDLIDKEYVWIDLEEEQADTHN